MRVRIGVITSIEGEELARRMGFDPVLVYRGLEEVPGLLEEALGREDVDILLVERDAFEKYSSLILEKRREKTFPLILRAEV